MSRFISSGSIDATTGKAFTSPPPTLSSSDPSIINCPTSPGLATDRAAEWTTVHHVLDEQKRLHLQERQQQQQSQQPPPRSLFDILQANKAAKQAAFEAKVSVRSQFRALDDEEADFLDEVRDARRAEEERVRREIEEELRAFREKRSERAGGGGGDEQEDRGEEVVDFAAGGIVGGRKRRREGLLVRGVKRKESGGCGSAGKTGEEGGSVAGGQHLQPTEAHAADGSGHGGAAERNAKDVPAKKIKLGLVDYASDDDD